MSAELELHVENRTFVPGDTIEATVRVLEGGDSRTLEAWLEYYEETEDLEGVGTRISIGTLHEGDLVTGMTFPLALTLPTDALPNYRSENGELYWRIHVRIDRLGRDLHQTERLLVSSGRTPTTT